MTIELTADGILAADHNRFRPQRMRSTKSASSELSPDGYHRWTISGCKHSARPCRLFRFMKVVAISFEKGKR